MSVTEIRIAGIGRSLREERPALQETTEKHIAANRRNIILIRASESPPILKKIKIYETNPIQTKSASYVKRCLGTDSGQTGATTSGFYLPPTTNEAILDAPFDCAQGDMCSVRSAKG